MMQIAEIGTQLLHMFNTVTTDVQFMQPEW